MESFGNSLQTNPKVILHTLPWHSMRTRTTHTLCVSFSLPCHECPTSSRSTQTDPSGLQLFHILSHTDGSGGTTLLVDGFYAASLLRELHPESYDVLARVPVSAHAAGEHAVLYKPGPPCGFPVLQHDSATEELVHVRWNNADRSVMSHLQPEKVEIW